MANSSSKSSSKSEKSKKSSSSQSAKKKTTKSGSKNGSKGSKSKDKVKKESKAKFVKHDIAEDTSANEDHEELVDLYRGDDEEGDAVDMTTLDRAKGRRTMVWVFSITILLLTVVAVTMGYLAFGPERGSVQDGEVELSVSSVETIASGDQLDISIEYENNTNSEIEVGSIEVLYPQGFYLRSADPQPVDQAANTWHVNNIPAGAKGTIDLTGQIVGQKDDTRTFTVLFTYSPVNFSSDFQVSEAFSVTLDESILDLDVEVQDRARNGETISYAFSFTNTSSLPLANVKAFVQYPEDFEVFNGNPTATQSDHTWEFDELDAGETQEVTVEGTFDADPGTEQEFTLQVGLQEPDGFFNVQSEIVSAVKIQNPDLSLEMSAPEFAQAGDEIEYEITVTNTSDVVIENIELTLDFEGDALESSEISLATIEEIQPNKSETVTQKVDVLPDVPDNVSKVVATLGILTAEVDGAAVEFDQTVDATTELQSSVDFTSEARYFDDDLTQLGDGPLPPQVGVSTEFVIRWTVEATGGDISDVQIQTTLPEGVQYLGSNDERIINSAGTVSADLRNVKSGITRVLDFTVAVTPEASDVNKLLVLANGTVLTATDSTSDSSIQVQTPQVTSSLSSDPGANSTDGTVVE